MAMTTREVKFTIKKNGGGKFKVETMGGFTGTSCDTTVNQILAHVGGVTTEKSGHKEDRYKQSNPLAWVHAD